MFNDYREPIEYVVDQYFNRKKISNNISSEDDKTRWSSGTYMDDSLPTTPCRLIRNEQGKVYKAIYGNLDALEDEEADPVIWQQELIFNADGTLEKVITTYPDGESFENILYRDSQGRLEVYG